MGIREEVLKLAEEAGIDCDDDGDIFGSTVGSLGRFYQAATIQAAERMKEEAALQGWMSASGDCEDRVRTAIRAIDVNKLFEKGEDDKA